MKKHPGSWRKNISRGELAKQVGVSRLSISPIKTGTVNPSAKLPRILCIAMEKNAEELFCLG